MGVGPNIEATGNHEYLVDLESEDDACVTVRVRASENLIDAVGGDVDEQKLISATVDFLIERQTADELPSYLDLQDVADAYDGYIDQMRVRLSK